MRKKKILQRPLLTASHSLPATLHPVMTRVYLARGVRSADDLDYALNRLPPPWSLGGIDVMARRLAEAIEAGRRILVVGDYDADGATASALAVSGLRALGGDQVGFMVPDRFRHGYGLSPALVEAALSMAPDVLVTVDNGITSLSGVAAAKAAGIEVLITDHHLPGAELPAADAIVNPNLPQDGFPSKALAGVGVMFYVLTALRAELRERGWFEKTGLVVPNLAALLDLVALGTVADVVPLDGVNRILVHHGLQRIRSGRARPGIQALVEVSGRNPRDLVASDLGFALGPRLNAAGRLEDMALGIRCLLAEDGDQARIYALKLDALNRQRREIEARMQADALRYLESGDWRDCAAPGVCLFDPGWHEGVIGILASRIKDRLGKPVIAFAESENGILKGSARSIPGVHIRDVLSAVDAVRPGLLARYGGHAMAAGVTLRRRDYETFARLFSEKVAEVVRELNEEDVIATDGALSGEDFSLSLAESLRSGGPWGQGFPEPLFHGDFPVVSSRIVGGRHLKMTLRSPAGAPLDAIAFSLDDPADWLSCNQLRMAFQLDVNEWRERRCLQLKVDYMEPVG